MERLESKSLPRPQSPSKRKVSGPTSQPKRPRSNEPVTPTSDSADATSLRARTLAHQSVANESGGLSYAWSDPGSPSRRHTSSLGSVVSEEAIAVAEEAEVAYIVGTPHDASSSEAPSPTSQQSDDEWIQVPSPAPAKSPNRERRVDPAHELRGHVKCRIYSKSIRRSELHCRSVLHSSDFDDIYEEYCNARQLKADYRDEVPFKLFSSVITTYGENLKDVCGSPLSSIGEY